MKRKTPFYVVIDLFNPLKTTIEQSKIQVAVLVGKHRNTIDFEQDKIYGHYLILPRHINKTYNKNRITIKGPFINLKNQV